MDFNITISNKIFIIALGFMIGYIGKVFFGYLELVADMKDNEEEPMPECVRHMYS